MIYSPGPSINSRDLESVVPATRISSLSLGPSANTMTVCFTVFPTATISPTVVEVESATIDLATIARCPRSSPRRRANLWRTESTARRHLGPTGNPIGRLVLLLLLHHAFASFTCSRCSVIIATMTIPVPAQTVCLRLFPLYSVCINH